MKPLSIVISIISVVIIIITSTGYTQQKGTPVFGRTDPSKYAESKSVHGSAGNMYFMWLLGPDDLTVNFLWMHRGVIPPHSGIGEHLQREMEDMFFAFNHPAEFTVNGRTALLPAGSCVLCPMGSSHGIYNNSDEPLEWMNIGVGTDKKFKVVDYNENLTNQTVESPAPFKWAQFDRSLLKPVTGAHKGKGTVFFRTLWNEDSFKTNWLRVGHILLPPDTSLGYHQHTAIEIVYYIMSGTGRMTVNDHTWDVKAGDAIPGQVYDSHGLYNNTDEELEIFYIVIAKEKGVNKVIDFGDDLSDR